MSELLNRVLRHEGFREKPYQDQFGTWHIGHGLSWISETESRAIVASRLHKIADELLGMYPWLAHAPAEVLSVTTEMAFQMGVTGVRRFKNMWLALSIEDYADAANEMLDSRWAQQTPERARELARMIAQLANQED